MGRGDSFDIVSSLWLLDVRSRCADQLKKKDFDERGRMAYLNTSFKVLWCNLIPNFLTAVMCVI